MKTILYLLVVLALLLSFTACGTRSNQPAAATATEPANNPATQPSASDVKEPVTMKYLIPGDLKPDEEKVMAIINKKLADDGIGVKIVREGIPWDVWADKINLKFASAEEFDMFHIMQDWIPYSNYYSRGALTDITDLVARYGPVLKEKVPEDMWEGSKIKGRNYIIPTYWIELAVDSNIFYRDDVFRKYNLQIPKNTEDFLNCYRTVRANWQGVNKPTMVIRCGGWYDPAVIGLSPPFHRLYDSYPFVVKEQFFQIFQDGTVKSWFESPEFKQDCEFMHEAYKEGIIHPDVLTLNNDWGNNYIANGDAFLWNFPNFEQAKKNNPNIKQDDLKSFRFAPEKPVIRDWGIKNCNGVSSTSRHPEGPIKFINWLWSSQENYDLYMYGIEGTHWKRDPNDERGIIGIKDPVTNQNSYQTGDDWKIGNINMVRYNATGFMAYNNIAFKEDVNAQNSIAGTFFFDPSSLATEFANVQAEAAAVIAPIAMGVQEYDKYYNSAISRLKAAGLDKLVAEYQRQLTAHINEMK